jgi:hypothetical protein
MDKKKSFLKYWIYPLLLGFVLAVINYFLMSANGDWTGRNFGIACMSNLFVYAVYFAVFCPEFFSANRKFNKWVIGIFLVIIFYVSCFLGSDKFAEKFDNESHLQTAILYKYFNQKTEFGKHRIHYFFNVKFTDETGKNVFLEREILIKRVYDQYEDGDTVIIKLSEKYPDYFEVIEKK